MPPRTIHFVTDHIRIKGLDTWAAEYASGLKAMSNSLVRVVDEPSEAEFILFLSAGIKSLRLFDTNHLHNHPLYRRFPQRCFMWCEQDEPLTFLPGLFASMPRPWYRAGLHRAFTYFQLPTASEPVPDLPRNILYNFIGGPTAPIRKRIVEMKHPEDAAVRGTVNYNHSTPTTDQVRRDYVKLLAGSRFTLCPRGVGTSSYRLFESMRAGSVPVILSDPLVEPDGPDWSRCSVRVPEAKLHEIAHRLREIPEAEALAMGQRAREAFAQFFAREVLLPNIVRLLEPLSPARPGAGRALFYGRQAESILRRIKSRLRRR